MTRVNTSGHHPSGSATGYLYKVSLAPRLAPRTQDNSHPTMSQLAPDSMLRAYCFRKTMLIIWYTLCSLKHGLFCFIPDTVLYSLSFWRMALKPIPSLTSTPALASSTGARGRDQPGKPRVWCWSGCELVRVRGCGLTSGVRVDSGASWYWGGLTRKPCTTSLPVQLVSA